MASADDASLLEGVFTYIYLQNKLYTHLFESSGIQNYASILNGVQKSILKKRSNKKQQQSLQPFEWNSMSAVNSA